MRSVASAVAALFFLQALPSSAANSRPEQGPPTPSLSPAAVLVLLTQRFPNIHFGDIHASSTIPGWFEISTDSELVYSDAAAEHLFVGYVVDAKTRENLTAQRWNELNIVDYKSLPFERAIKTVRGDGSRQLVVFEDPLCPYCRQLEQGMADLTDVTIYTFLFPLETLHPGATIRARQIWCSADRASVWSAWMKRADGAPDLPAGMDENGSCDGDPIAENRALGQQLHINATPTLIFSDGSRVAAAVPKDEIEKRLQHAAADPKNAKVTARIP